MALALVGIGLFALCAGFVAYGMAGTQHQQASGWLGWASRFAHDLVTGSKYILENIVPLSSYLLHELGSVYNAVYSQCATWLGGVENFVRMSGAATYEFALAMNDWSKWLVNVEIPKLVHAIPGEAAKVARDVGKKVGQVERTVVKIVGLSAHAAEVEVKKVIAHDFPFLLPELRYIKAHWKQLLKILATAGAIAIPGLLDIPGSLRRWVEKGLSDLWKRIKANEKKLTGVVAAAVVAEALRKLGMSWARCTNWKRLGRAGCNLSPGSITHLLGLIAGLAVLDEGLSLEALAKKIQTGLVEGEGLVVHFWQADVKATLKDRQLGSAT